MSNQDKYHTQLDQELKDLAATDWQAFVDLVGFENVRKAKVCILMRKGKSLNQISIRLGITKHQAEYACANKCPKISDTA